MLQTNHQTDGPTNIAPYKVACTKLKRNKEKRTFLAQWEQEKKRRDHWRRPRRREQELEIKKEGKKE